MNKRIRLFYIFFIIMIIMMTISCLNIGNNNATSFPWWVGLLFPAVFFTIPLLLYAIFIAKKDKHYLPLIIMSFLVLIQIAMLF